MAILLKIIREHHLVIRPDSYPQSTYDDTDRSALSNWTALPRPGFFFVHRRLANHAFSTTELMIAVLLVAMLATFSAPHLGRWLSVIKVNAAARNLASELQLGRMRAISENTRFRITFDISAEAYQIHKNIAGQWQDVDSIQPLPNGIDLETATTNPIFFQTLGTVAAGSSITLRNSQNQRRRITVSRSGRVNIKRVP